MPDKILSNTDDYGMQKSTPKIPGGSGAGSGSTSSQIGCTNQPPDNRPGSGPSGLKFNQNQFAPVSPSGGKGTIVGPGEDIALPRK